MAHLPYRLTLARFNGIAG